MPKCLLCSQNNIGKMSESTIVFHGYVRSKTWMMNACLLASTQMFKEHHIFSHPCMPMYAWNYDVFQHLLPTNKWWPTTHLIMPGQCQLSNSTRCFRCLCSLWKETETSSAVCKSSGSLASSTHPHQHHYHHHYHHHRDQQQQQYHQLQQW